MGDKEVRIQERKYVNVITGEERVITYEVEVEDVWESVIARGGERGDMDGFDNELCNLSYYVGMDVWGEIVKREGLDEWDWEWEMM